MKSLFADLRYSRITLLTAAWAFVVAAAPRLLVGAFYAFHWLQQRASRVPDDSTFFVAFQWVSWWAPAIIIAALPLTLLIARARTRWSSTSSTHE